MVMGISEADVNLLLRLATERAAAATGIRVGPGVPTETAISEVRARNSRLADALTRFQDAYGDWFRFHQQLEAEGRQGAMSLDEHAQLVGLSDGKDRARATFISELERAEATQPP